MDLSHATHTDTPEMIEYYERRKFIILGMVFFMLIGAYTIVQAIKDSIFGHIVGRYWINYARFGSMCILMPAIIFYSKLVDKLRRYYLLCFYSAFYALFSLVFAYFLSDPTIGIANGQADPSRWFGWLFYFFVEGFSPFVVSVFWAFVNSVSSPTSAKRRYGTLTACSKTGGMLSALLCWLLLIWKDAQGNYLFSDTVNHQILLFLTALFLSGIPFLILYLMHAVPGRFLHGYEAAYQAEKAKKMTGKSQTGVFAGIKMLLKYPYVMGIFGMVFFHELFSTILSYLRLRVAQENSESISGVSAILFQIVFMTHLTGFFISAFGTRVLLNKLGERVCLLLIPISMSLVMCMFMFYTASPFAIVLAFVLLKAINYAFSWPVRESLYIPTVKEIKFKSKSWIDAFGAKFGKSAGASFNLFSEWAGPGLFVMTHSIFFFMVIFCWLITAWALGKRFDYAVKHNEVIGLGVNPEEQGEDREVAEA